MARLLKALATKDRSMIMHIPQPRHVDAASQVIFQVASRSTFTALKQGKLLALGAQESEGLVKVARSRVGQARLAQLLGNADLSVVMPSELFARKIVVRAHEEDHCLTTRDVAAHVRRTGIIPGGNSLIKSVLFTCMKCRTRRKEISSQIMGDLPDKKLSGAAPFIYCAVDMFGPWLVTNLAKGRRSLKTWGVMFSCLPSKALAILACPGYDTNNFSLTYRMFCASVPRGARGAPGKQKRASAWHATLCPTS